MSGRPSVSRRWPAQHTHPVQTRLWWPSAALGDNLTWAEAAVALATLWHCFAHCVLTQRFFQSQHGSDDSRRSCRHTQLQIRGGRSCDSLHARFVCCWVLAMTQEFIRWIAPPRLQNVSGSQVPGGCACDAGYSGAVTATSASPPRPQRW